MLLRALFASLGLDSAIVALRSNFHQAFRRASLALIGGLCLLVALGFATAWGWLVLRDYWGSEGANLALAGIFLLVGGVFVAVAKSQGPSRPAPDLPKPLSLSPPPRMAAPAGEGSLLGAVGAVAITGFAIGRSLRNTLRDRSD